MRESHSFSVSVAKKVGVNAAVILHTILWWHEWAKDNGADYRDGQYWIPCSMRSWQKAFPYLGRSAIETALGKLVDAGYVKVGNYNDTSFDRTKWYAITELGIKAMEE